MAKKKQPTKNSEAKTSYGPRLLCWWHGDHRVTPSLCWFENSEKGGVKVQKCLHVLTLDGGRVVYAKHPPDSIKYMSGIVTEATAKTMEERLKSRLLEFGGDPEAWDFLGVERPKIEPGAAPPAEASQDLLDLYDRAARLLKVPVDDLQEKYKHLNNGLQAMNLRNRLRAKKHNV